MSKHTLTLTPQLVRKICAYAGVGFTCIVSSFAIGIQTAGDVESIGGGVASALEASVLPADAGEGHGAIQDAVMILEIADGSVSLPSDWQTLDRNHDGSVTAADALMILRSLTH